MEKIISLNQNEINTVSGGTPVMVIAEHLSEFGTGALYAFTGSLAFAIINRKHHLEHLTSKNIIVQSLVGYFGSIISGFIAGSFGVAAYRGNAINNDHKKPIN